MTTVWLDTNVILRYLLEEPKDHFKRAKALLTRAAAGELRVHVSAIVAAEVMAILVHSYDVPRSDAAQALIDLLSARGARTEADVVDALELTRDQKVDFVDAYTWLTCRQANAELASFDRDFATKLRAKVFNF